MSALTWVLAGLLWCVLAVPLALVVGRTINLRDRLSGVEAAQERTAHEVAQAGGATGAPVVHTYLTAPVDLDEMRAAMARGARRDGGRR